MVIFDIGAAFLVGGAIAKRTGGQCRDLALVAGGLGCGAPGLFFLESYPDWDWVRPHFLSRLFSLPAFSDTGLELALNSVF